MVIDSGGSSQNKGILTNASASQNKANLSGASASQKTTSVGPGPAPLAKGALAPADNVSLSARAQTLIKLETRITQAPEVNRSKVESIKQALAEGRYSVDPKKIATAMLADENTAP